MLALTKTGLSRRTLLRATALAPLAVPAIARAAEAEFAYKFATG